MKGVFKMEKTYVIERGQKHNPILGNHFDALRWLEKATCKEKMRQDIFRTIHIQDGIFFSTDGYRANVYCPNYDELPNQEEYMLPDGNYTVVSANNKQIILRGKENSSFPDIWRILSYRPAANGIGEFYGHSRKDWPSFDDFVYHLYREQKRKFRMKHLEDFYFDGKIKFERQENGDELNSPLVMGNEERLSIIMPLPQYVS
jgi:hypothetical protein